MRTKQPAEPANVTDIRDHSPAAFLLVRLPEVKVIRNGDEVTVILPETVPRALVGFLIDEALRRAGLHPGQQ